MSIILKTALIIGLSSTNISNAENDQAKNTQTQCESNALHYSASINDVDYFKELLNLNTFTVTDLNHECDSVYHIAIQNNNKAILKELFNYIDIKEIYNQKGENLTQHAIKHQQPEILIFLINEGVDLNSKSLNGENSFDYQAKYGNEVSLKILNDFERSKLLKTINNEKESYLGTLNALVSRLDIKEDELEALEKNPNSPISATNLKQEIELLKNQIEFLTNIINDKNSEITRLKELLKTSNVDLDKIDAVNNLETLDVNAIIQSEITINKDGLIDISNDHELNDNKNKILNILSRPIYKIEE